MDQTITKEEYERLLACAVEAQAMREALVRFHDLLRLAQRVASASEPRLLKYAESAREILATIKINETLESMSAPSESERVLAARDERVRAQAEADLNAEWRAIQEPGEHPDEADAIARHDAKVRADERARVAAALNVEGHRLRESSNDSEQWGIADGHLRAAILVESHPIAPYSATPPSAASAVVIGDPVLSIPLPPCHCVRLVEHPRAAPLPTALPDGAMREVARELLKETARQVVTPRTRDLLRALLGMDEMGRPAPSAASGKCAMCGGTKLVRNTHVPRLDDPEWWPCPTCAASGKENER